MLYGLNGMINGFRNCNQFVGCPKSSAYRLELTECAIRIVKDGGGSIQFWGSLSWNLEGLNNLIEEVLNARGHVNTLSGVILFYLEKNIPLRWVFQMIMTPNIPRDYHKSG